MSGRLRRLSAAAAVAFATAMFAAPAANAGPVDDLLNKLTNTVNETVQGLLGGSGGGEGQPAPATPTTQPAPAASSAAPAPQAATTDPPLSSTDPHGSGTVLGADLEAVLTPGENDVIVGEATGEQDAQGNYHGRITVVSALGLDLIQVTTDEGETQSSPLGAVNDLLDEVCSASGNNVCLNALNFSSQTTENGSGNSFSAADLSVGDGLITTGLITSEGNISETNNCQTASGESSVANLAALGALGVAALQSSSQSTACRDQAPQAGADSEVLNLNGIGLLDLLGCDGTTVDDEFGIPTLLEGVCNGDDTNGAQADAPYNVRKALQLDLLPLLNELLDAPLASLEGASAESLAVAPEGDDGDDCPDPGNPDCPGGPDDDGDEDPPGSGSDPEGDGDRDGDGVPDSEDACPDVPGPASNDGCPLGGGPSGDGDGDGELPFTGADMATMGLIGFAVMAFGLALMGLSDRRRRTLRG